MSLNVVIIAGNMVRDPEVKFIQGDRAVCKFAIAINERWKKDGETKERVSFVECEAWGKTAELVGQFMTKGSACTVQGKLEQESWEDKDGGKRSRLKVVAERVHFGAKRGQEQGDAPAPRTTVPTGGGSSARADDPENPPFLSLATGDAP